MCSKRGDIESGQPSNAWWKLKGNDRLSCGTFDMAIINISGFDYHLKNNYPCPLKKTSGVSQKFKKNHAIIHSELG